MRAVTGLGNARQVAAPARRCRGGERIAQLVRQHRQELSLRRSASSAIRRRVRDRNGREADTDARGREGRLYRVTSAVTRVGRSEQRHVAERAISSRTDSESAPRLVSRTTGSPTIGAAVPGRPQASGPHRWRRLFGDEEGTRADRDLTTSSVRSTQITPRMDGAREQLEHHRAVAPRRRQESTRRSSAVRSRGPSLSQGRIGRGFVLRHTSQMPRKHLKGLAYLDAPFAIRNSRMLRFVMPARFLMTEIALPDLAARFEVPRAEPHRQVAGVHGRHHVRAMRP